MPSGDSPKFSLSRLRWTEDSWDWVFVAAVTVFYLVSFRLTSQVNGPIEVYGQDSVYILETLAARDRYFWNAQSHILYHMAVDGGYRLTLGLFSSGLGSAYAYLKLFTAACGTAFFTVLVLLFRELGLSVGRRLILMAFSAVSLAAWFHFAAFESHALALPGVALYLLVLARMRREGTISRESRILLVVALLWCGWTRVDLFRFAACSLLLLVLPQTRALARRLARDLALVFALGFVGNTVMCSLYFFEPPWKVATRVLERGDRASLEAGLSTVKNLRPEHFAATGRAMAVYAVIAPVEAQKPERSFFAPPSYHLDLPPLVDGVTPSTELDLEPVKNLSTNALSLTVLLGYLALLAAGAKSTWGRIQKWDTLHVMIVTQACFAWVFYTWFNPHEPFLWVLEGLPLLVVVFAEALRDRGRLVWGGLLVLTLLLVAHNTFAFYLPFL